MKPTLANKNNNPGNLRDPRLGTFRQFKTPQEGYAALLNDLQGKKDGTSHTGIGPTSTLSDFAKVWAPPEDSNDPAQYAANLANHMGVRPDAQISSLDLGKWADAISHSEGYKPGESTSEEVEVAKPKESLSDQLSKRVADAGEAVKTLTSGSFHGALSGILQLGGAAAGGVNDIIGKGIEHIPGVKPVEEVIGSAVGKLADTGAGKAVVGKVNEFSQNHPELSKDISSVGNIAGLIGGGIGAKKVVEEGVAKAVGRDSLASIASDITPPATGKALAKNIAKRGTSKSLLTGEIGAAADPSVLESAKAIDELIPNYKKLGTFSEKVNAVQGGIKTTAEELVDNLKKSEVQPLLTREDIAGLKKSIETEVAKNPVLVGDAGEQAHRIFNHFVEILPKGRDITMSDVLQARKDLDSWIEKIKGSNAFDPKMENAFTTALRAVRQGANGIMEAKVPDAGVKALLKKQSLLYDALDGLSPKAAKEIGSTRASRFFGRHPLMTGLLKKTGAAAGTVGLGALGIAGYNELTKD